MNVPENPNEQADEEQTATPQPSCDVCGHALSPGARFCIHCGASASRSGRRIIRLAVASSVLFVTLTWIIALWLVNEPVDYSDAVDVARFDATVYSFTFGVWLPWLVVFALAVYGIRTMFISRRSLTPGTDGLIARLVVLVSFTWLFVSLIVLSEPGIGLLVTVLWFSFSFALGISWLGFLVSMVFRIWRTRSRWPRLMIAYVILPSLAMSLLIALISQAIPLRVRFELSEGSLTELATRCARDLSADPRAQPPESCRGSHRAGLFNVDGVLERNGCVILATEVFIEYIAGFAYCTRGPPKGDYVRADHLKSRWWTYVYDSNRGP